MTPRLVLIALAALAALLVAPAGPASAGSSKDLSVDYLIGMLESGMDQQEIVSRITENHLTFRLEEGDLERLRDAGAGEALARAVARDGWSRPRRLDQPAPSSPQGDYDVGPPSQGEDDDWMTPRRGDYGYGPAYYPAPWFYGYVYYDPFYPYYYYPRVYTYYPYSVYYHGGFHGPRISGHPGRTPRGPGGSAGPGSRAPRGPRGSH